MIALKTEARVREELAWLTASHLRGLADVCTIIWCQFGFTDGVGVLVDNSGWATLDHVCLGLWDYMEEGERDWRDAPPSELAVAVTNARLDNQPELWDEETRIPISETGRVTTVAYLTELMALLEQAIPIIPESWQRIVDPSRQLRLWSEVRDVLVGFVVPPDQKAAA